MKIKKLVFILFISLILPTSGYAQSSNLDEIYREIVRADNEDYLPMFVKNRQSPDFLKDIEDIEAMQKQNLSAGSLDDVEKIISFENKKKILETKKQAQELKWQAIVLAVQQNKATPYEVNEIKKKVMQNDPQAIELFAFMNARGIGLKQNLIEAFLLYQQALNLDVANAKENAILVYQSMSYAQKAELKLELNAQN